MNHQKSTKMIGLEESAFGFTEVVFSEFDNSTIELGSGISRVLTGVAA